MNYPPSGPPKLHQQNYSFSNASFDSPIQLNAAMHTVTQRHYRPEPERYQHQYQNVYYENTYNVPLIGDRMSGSNNAVRGQASSYYGNRARYFPYQHSIPPHSIRGMYTPAGQQLIPSSVLHYPPRSSSYEQNTLPLPLQKQSSQSQAQYTLPPYSQQQLSQQSQSHRSTPSEGNEPQYHKDSDALKAGLAKEMQSPPHLLLHLNGGDSSTSTQTPPLSIVSPPISQSKTRPSSTDFDFYMDAKRKQPMHIQQKLLEQQCSRTPSIQTFSADELSTEQLERTQQIAPSLQQSPIVKLPPANNTLSELSTMREDAEFNIRVNHDNQQHKRDLTHSIVENNGAASIGISSNTSTSTIGSPPLAASRDCLTTTPPLISATGTDSGISISSCCTRNPSDSTHSTPAYIGEYPPSVGSSSGLSYHCSDIKDLDEFSREKEESTTNQAFNENIILKLKQEDTVYESNEGKGMTSAGLKENSYNIKESENKKNHSEYKNSLYDDDALASCGSRDNSITTKTSLMQKQNAPTKTSECDRKSFLDSNGSNDIVKELSLEEGATKLSIINGESQEYMEKYLTQPNMSNEQKQGNKQIGNISTDSVYNNYISSGVYPNFDNREFKQQELPSPPPPAPPQSSPVDYCLSTSSNKNAFGYITVPSTQLKPPSTGAAAAAAAAVVAAAAAAAAASIRTNKNRIEFDSMTSKKTNRKINFVSGKWQNDNEEFETNESNRKKKDMTPLPGFQQAFGSTEIGRFFEKFLFSPQDFHNSNDGYDSFDVGDQLQQTHRQHQEPQQNQFSIKHEQQKQDLNQIQQQYMQQENFNQKYTENNAYPTQRLHPRYPHPHLHYRYPYYRDQPYPFQITAANNYRDMCIYGRPAHSLYDLPFEYGSSHSGSCPLSSPYEMPLNVRSAYGSSYDRIGYSYGIKNSNYSGIRCNGY